MCILTMLGALDSGAGTMGHGGARAPHFYEWLGMGGTVEERLITTMQLYANNSTADCRTEIKFYLEIRTYVIARYSQ